jgi:TolA-binding protein
MNFKSAIVLVLLAMLLVPLTASRGSDKEKDQLKQSVDDLKAEVTVLERQIRDMQQSVDRNSGTTTTLITQMVDNVSAIRQGQSRSAESAVEAVNRISGFSEKLNATNDRVGRISDQITDLKRDLQNLCKQPAIPDASPGNPDDMMGAGVADYHRRNYQLALSEFKQYVDTFGNNPESLAKGQFWIGECYFSMSNYNEAIAAYEKVPARGDDRYYCGARLKKIKALRQLGQSDAASAELSALTSLAGARVKPKCQEELRLAQQDLNSR